MKMRKYGAAAAAALALFCGCRTQDAETVREIAGIRSELAAMNLKIDSISEKVGRMQAGGGIREAKGPDFEALAKIRLPENPTDGQIREYIRKIQAHSAGQMVYAPGDPQVAMLRRIGPGRLQAILPFFGTGEIPHLGWVAGDLVGEKDKELVRRELVHYPQLASVVVQKGWAKEMVPELLQVMEEGRRVPPALVENAGVLAGTPENRRRLAECYRTKSGCAGLLPLIETFPGVDVDALTVSAWKHFSGKSPFLRIDYAQHAARHGSAEALGDLIYIYQDKKFAARYQMRGLLPLLSSLTGQSSDPEKLLAWYEANRDRLVFDRERGRFSAGSAQ